MRCLKRWFAPIDRVFGVRGVDDVTKHATSRTGPLTARTVAVDGGRQLIADQSMSIGNRVGIDRFGVILAVDRL